MALTHKANWSSRNTLKGSLILLTLGVLGAATLLPLHAQSTAPEAKPAPSSAPFRNQPPRVSNRAGAFYESIWGIEAPSIKAVESGVILRFSYRVLDPEKAKMLLDKKLNPVIESPEKGVSLVIPSMEKVGQLRQAPDKIEAGKSYWMAFSNSGRVIRPGDRVDVVIGNFHARGIQVE